MPATYSRRFLSNARCTVDPDDEPITELPEETVSFLDGLDNPPAPSPFILEAFSNRRKTPTPPRRKTPTPPRRKTPTPPRRKTPTPPRRKTPTPPRRKTPTPPSRKTPTPPSRIPGFPPAIEGSAEEVAEFISRATTLQQQYRKSREVQHIRKVLFERIEAHEQRYVALVQFLNNKREEYTITLDFVSKLPPAEMDKHIAALQKKKTQLELIQRETKNAFDLYMSYVDLGKALNLKKVSNKPARYRWT